MDEDKKYYTPDEEDLFINYECETLVPDIGDRWVYRKLTSEDIQEAVDGNYDIRTKYLDRSDIESCGWEYVGSIKEGFWEGKYDQYMIKHDDGWSDGYQTIWILILPVLKLYGTYDSSNTRIHRIQSGGFIGNTEERDVFYGTIKSKNELLKIMQYNGVKIKS